MALPVRAVLGMLAMSAKRSAGSVVSSLLERSSQPRRTPWNKRGGTVSNALPDRSMWRALTRYAKSCQLNEVSFGDAGSVLSGRRFSGLAAVVAA